ncbi:MAG: hypothetical protein MJZ34_13870 [Paludibacteraceae bacterium]|nr:hypothetical protein [Paludibacteraceae bacterium]
MKTFVDPRDNEEYTVEQQNDLYVMIHPLRYIGTKHAFPDMNSDNVNEYGCLYDYLSIQDAIPEGWRLPTKDEWKKISVKDVKAGCKHWDCYLNFNECEFCWVNDGSICYKTKDDIEPMILSRIVMPYQEVSVTMYCVKDVK